MIAEPQACAGETARRAGARGQARHTSAVALALALAGTLAVALLLQSAKPFYYDSLNYWTLGETFSKHGDFSLLNFNSPLRGYLIPLIDHGLRGAATLTGWSASVSAKLFNVLVFALIGAILGPKLAQIAWPQQPWGIGRRLALVAVLIVFWSGYLNFPLSDFPALAFVLLALVASSRPDLPGWMVVAGLATGAAIDSRPSYTPLLAIVPVLVVWELVRRRGRRRLTNRRAALSVALLVVGFAAVSLPQSLVSHRYFDTWSFVPGSAANLESVQLNEGLRLQRYETFVGPGHPPQMRYTDPSGSRLLAGQPGETVTGIGQYLGLIVDHPLTMGGIFIRHVINGLDQRYSTPYIERIDTGSHRWMRLAGFLLVFLALLRVAWPAARRSLGSARWRYPVALLLCCTTAVPSAMETRFMLPACLLAYIVVLAPGWPSPLTSGTGIGRFRRLAAIALTYAAFMAVVWSVVSATSTHLSFG